MILETFRKEGQPTLIKDVYNVLYTIKVASLDGHTPSQAALAILDKQEHIYHAWVEQGTGRLDGLLLASHESVALTRQYGLVLMIDATFRTNRYNLPALHIVCKSGIGFAFTSAIIWMPNLEEISYIRALEIYKRLVLNDSNDLVRVVVTDREQALRNAVSRVLPKATAILCQLHILQNVNTNGRKGLGISNEVWNPLLKAWKNGVMYAETEEGANQARADLARK